MHYFVSKLPSDFRVKVYNHLMLYGVSREVHFSGIFAAVVLIFGFTSRFPIYHI